MRAPLARVGGQICPLSLPQKVQLPTLGWTFVLEVLREEPSGRRYDISVRPKSLVQPLMARIGAQMRQISLSWWLQWPALGCCPVSLP